MTYTLRFLPEVEEDVVSGYVWYEEKAPGLGEELLRVFYAIRCFTRRCMEDFDVDCCGDSPTPFTSRWKVARLSCTGCSIVLVIPTVSDRACETGEVMNEHPRASRPDAVVGNQA